MAFNWHCCIGRPRSRRRNWRDETSQSRRGSWSDPRAWVRAGPGARSAAARAPNDLGVGPTSPFRPARLAVEGLLLLLGVGGGWTWVAAHPWLRSFEIAAMAPAVGIAALVLGTVLLSAVGLPVRGPGAWLIVGSLGTPGWMLGWMLAGAVARRPAASGDLSL